MDGGFVLSGVETNIFEPAFIVYASSDLKTWREVARIHNVGRFQYFLPPHSATTGFYRFELIAPPVEWTSE